MHEVKLLTHVTCNPRLRRKCATSIHNQIEYLGKRSENYLFVLESRNVHDLKTVLDHDTSRDNVKRIELMDIDVPEIVVNYENRGLHLAKDSSDVVKRTIVASLLPRTVGSDDEFKPDFPRVLGVYMTFTRCDFGPDFEVPTSAEFNPLVYIPPVWLRDLRGADSVRVMLAPNPEASWYQYACQQTSYMFQAWYKRRYATLIDEHWKNVDGAERNRTRHDSRGSRFELDAKELDTRYKYEDVLMAYNTMQQPSCGPAFITQSVTPSSDIQAQVHAEILERTRFKEENLDIQFCAVR